MTLTQITVFFLMILSVIGISMLIHSWIDKGRIRKNLLRLSSEISGQATQENRLIYPRFTGEMDGRTFDFFFQVVKAGRKHILYVIYSLKSDIGSDLLLLKSTYFKPILDQAQFTAQAGDSIAGLDAPYEIRSKNPEEARQIFERSKLSERLPALEGFTTLQLGPDAIVAGKPYDGPSDTEPTNILRNVRMMKTLAEAIERCGVPV